MRQQGAIPRHIAIIMDGNGRWAKERKLPRISGHSRGLEVIRGIVQTCIEIGVKYLSLFAFSSENWQRPCAEVAFLMRLFSAALRRELKLIDKNQICLKIIGDLSKFNLNTQKLITKAQSLTVTHNRLTLTIAANYGGRWDICQACKRLISEINLGNIDANIDTYVDTYITEAKLNASMATSYAPDPDLFIRTGGEQRISNFMLWQLTYTELYFSKLFWPDFNAAELHKAIAAYQTRERRFGNLL